ncbi:MAG: hypothetical protein WC768_05310 [Patescibacteria group bacterium]|jgi:hypothetical protein
MQNLQTIFDRLQKSKKEQSEIRKAYKDSLKNSAQFQKIIEELDNLRIKKKEIEDATKADFGSSMQKLESLKYDIETDLELLSDVALNQFVKGEPISLTDEKKNQYEPIFSVKFRKI